MGRKGFGHREKENARGFHWEGMDKQRGKDGWPPRAAEKGEVSPLSREGKGKEKGGVVEHDVLVMRGYDQGWKTGKEEAVTPLGKKKKKEGEGIWMFVGGPRPSPP